MSIYSKYPSAGQLPTFRADTSICVSLLTPMGTLAVYDTVIGNSGNRREDFIVDLDQQLLDYKKIAENSKICISGDLNISFSDNYYFTVEGRTKLNASIIKNDLFNIT